MLVPGETKIYCYLPAVDMRKAVNGLCMLIADELKMNPTEGYLFLFRNRGKDKLKALYYEPNCFNLWYRRLEQGKFIFPVTEEGVIEMTEEHFKWLLASDKYRHLEVGDKKYLNFI
jgi:IS66 Orf2 like protein.